MRGRNCCCIVSTIVACISSMRRSKSGRFTVMTRSGVGCSGFVLRFLKVAGGDDWALRFDPDSDPDSSGACCAILREI